MTVPVPQHGTMPRYEQEEQLRDESFPQMVKRYRAKYDLKAPDLAERIMGIREDIFRRKCNGNGPSSRDFVIAVCAVLLMDSVTAGEALRAHKEMYAAFDEENDRDMCIIEFLDNTRFNRPEQEVVKSLNRVLRNHNYPELDIIDHRNRKAPKGKSDVPDTPYKITGKGFRLLSSDTALYGDQYDSLETEYSLSRCRCMGWFKAENTDTGNICILECTSDGSMYLYGMEELIPRRVTSPEEVGELAPLFYQLQTMTESYHRTVIGRLNDSRNFGERVSANLQNGKIHIFAERYNYEYPEAQEYYVMEYTEGVHVLSIYRKSAFMALYLPREEYAAYVSNEIPTPVYQFESLEAIDAIGSDPKASGWQIQLIPLRKKAYKTLLRNVDNLLDELKEKKKYIRHPDILIDNEDPGWVCKFFRLEDQYACYTEEDEEGREWLYYGNYIASFDQPDETTISITVDELKKAFELGFHDIQEICAVKRSIGTIDAIY